MIPTRHIGNRLKLMFDPTTLLIRFKNVFSADNVKSLTNSDVRLCASYCTPFRQLLKSITVEEMKAIGHRVLQGLGVPISDRRYG